MSTLPPQPVALSCPSCGTRFQTPVFQYVDVGQQPELKQALLAGRLNMAVCPSCGSGGLLATPMVYHDPDKQLFWALFPQEVNAKPEEQERFIGTLQQLAMRSVLEGKPKGYLLNPRKFITLTSMLDALLEAEGISKEDLARQRQRTELLARLLQAEEDDDAFGTLVDDNRDALDYEFFMTLAAYIEAAGSEGDTESLSRFETLRDKLLELTGTQDPAAGEAEPSLDAAVDALLEAGDDGLEEAIAEYRPLIDYGFYEALTERADAAREAGNTAQAERIEARRAAIMETTERMDREAQEMFEGAANALRAVLEAEDPREALREHRAQLGEAFSLVLDANRDAAERAGRSDVVERLDQIGRLAVEVVEESLSPEERLIAQLLGAETPQEATRLLRKNAAQVNPDFVKQLNAMAAEMDGNGREEAATRLKQLGREAAALLF
jgi:CpXC protein